MYPFITLGDLTIPTMWFTTVGGGVVAAIFVLLRARALPLPMVDVTNAGALGMVGLLIGGKLLYLLTILPVLIRAWAFLMQNTALLAEILTSGTVFYGGLFGFLGAVWWYLRHYHLPQPPFWDCLAPAIPLFHLFGRVGCFLNGCCYGFESQSLGIAFSHSIGAPKGIPYFPVQLVEAACNGVLFLILWQYEKRHRGQGKTLPLYLGLYALLRFCLEFLRGDVVRGIWWGLSTSQWISLGILLVLLWRRRHRKVCC